MVYRRNHADFNDPPRCQPQGYPWGKSRNKSAMRWLFIGALKYYETYIISKFSSVKYFFNFPNAPPALSGGDGGGGGLSSIPYPRPRPP